MEADCLREMSGRSRGEPPKTLINKHYSFQVVLYLTDELRQRLLEVIADEHRLDAYHLHGYQYHEGYHFSIVKFATMEGQHEFIRLYGGVPYDPTDKKSKPWETYFDR
ncbi:hypothetical protein [Brucella intermedia]|uniref:hypothetical protein n=1 Tax=Brucella intermedia TaxID=94625 RepID=UPI0007C6C3F1|nr:hypothetical protein [Brucella intermedia]OAE39742.1 hypothetical protein A7J42_14705 [Brucella intermedia]